MSHPDWILNKSDIEALSIGINIQSNGRSDSVNEDIKKLALETVERKEMKIRHPDMYFINNFCRALINLTLGYRFNITDYICPVCLIQNPSNSNPNQLQSIINKTSNVISKFEVLTKVCAICIK